MIGLNATLNPSEHVRSRAKNCWVRTVAPDRFIVKPKEKGKARRVVSFIKTQQGIKIECRDLRTGELCPANSFRRACGHVEASINRLLANNKRRENRERKERAEAKERNQRERLGRLLEFKPKSELRKQLEGSLKLLNQKHGHA